MTCYFLPHGTTPTQSEFPRLCLATFIYSETGCPKLRRLVWRKTWCSPRKQVLFTMETLYIMFTWCRTQETSLNSAYFCKCEAMKLTQTDLSVLSVCMKYIASLRDFTRTASTTKMPKTRHNSWFLSAWILAQTQRHELQILSFKSILWTSIQFIDSLTILRSLHTKISLMVFGFLQSFSGAPTTQNQHCELPQLLSWISDALVHKPTPSKWPGTRGNVRMKREGSILNKHQGEKMPNNGSSVDHQNGDELFLLRQFFEIVWWNLQNMRCLKASHACKTATTLEERPKKFQRVLQDTSLCKKYVSSRMFSKWPH